MTVDRSETRVARTKSWLAQCLHVHSIRRTAKSRFAGLIIAIALSGAVAGCGSTNSADNKNATPIVAEQQTEAPPEPIPASELVQDDSPTVQDSAEDGQGDGVVSAESRPNLLLLIADDFGLDKATFDAANPCYDTGDASDDAALPNLAALCQNGVRFENAWAMPICSPTRATMLTGQFPFRHGIGAPLGRNDNLSLEAATLPGILDSAESGYATANIGKWHVSHGATDPNTVGWDHFSGVLSGRVRNYERWDRTVNGVTESSNVYATTANVDDAISWLNGVPPDQPWLLWMAFNAPHTPFHLPPTDLHDYDELPEHSDATTNNAPYYAAMTQAMDTEIGRLIEHLKERGQWENTVVVFIGDNGTPGPVATAPFTRRTAKGTLSEGGIAVPMIIAGAGVEGGRSVSQIVSVVDIFSTFLDAAEVDLATVALEEPIDSVSLWPLLSGESTAELHTHIIAEQFGGDERAIANAGRAIRDSRYKLICYADGRTNLFDLQVDPWERVELIANGTAPDGTVEALAHELGAMVGADVCQP